MDHAAGRDRSQRAAPGAAREPPGGARAQWHRPVARVGGGCAHGGRSAGHRARAGRRGGHLRPRPGAHVARQPHRCAPGGGGVRHASGLQGLVHFRGDGPGTTDPLRGRRVLLHPPHAGIAHGGPARPAGGRADHARPAAVISQARPRPSTPPPPWAPTYAAACVRCAARAQAPGDLGLGHRHRSPRRGSGRGARLRSVYQAAAPVDAARSRSSTGRAGARPGLDAAHAGDHAGGLRVRARARSAWTATASRT